MCERGKTRVKLHGQLRLQLSQFRLLLVLLDRLCWGFDCGGGIESQYTVTKERGECPAELSSRSAWPTMDFVARLRPRLPPSRPSCSIFSPPHTAVLSAALSNPHYVRPSSDASSTLLDHLSLVDLSPRTQKPEVWDEMREGKQNSPAAVPPGACIGAASAPANRLLSSSCSNSASSSARSWSSICGARRGSRAR